MNDEFLHQFYEAPRDTFRDALYQRISQQRVSRLTETFLNKLTLRNVAIALAFLLFVAACVYAVTEQRWHKVGEIWVDVQRTFKADFSPLSDDSVSEQPVTPSPAPECFTLQEAREMLRFEVRIPAWAPEGFTFDDNICGIDRTSDFAGLYWKGADPSSGIMINLHNRKMFNMSTQKYEIMPAFTMGPVAPGSFEEVQIHGQPAVLIHGDWEWPWITGKEVKGEMELKWNKKQGLQLYWIEGEVLYNLITPADVSAEDLIRMAESTH